MHYHEMLGHFMLNKVKGHVVDTNDRGSAYDIDYRNPELCSI